MALRIQFFQKVLPIDEKSQFKGGLFEKIVCILGVMKPSLIFGVVEIGSHPNVTREVIRCENFVEIIRAP